MTLHTSESKETIESLFEAHFHKLVLSAIRYVKDYDEASEIVQDVFVKIWQNYEKIKDVKDLRAYLFKAVKNSSFNYLKHIKVKERFINQSMHLGESVEKSREETISDEETRQKINEAINKLPPNWREALLLSKYNRLKYHEIAEEMDISPKTVEKYISKAFSVLRVELKDVHFISIIFLNIFSHK